MRFWYRDRRRKRVRNRPFPHQWIEIVERNVPYYHLLSGGDREELHGHIQVLLHEKHFEGFSGFEITDEVRVTIAANAAILLLRRAGQYYPGLCSILVYPTSFVVDTEELDDAGVLEEYTDVFAGESWDRGVVILAWDEVQQGLADPADGYNVVLHEFAHQLDQEGGPVEGFPELASPELYRRWARVMGKHYRRLVEDAADRCETFLDEYGAVDPAEFFAVVTETFFEIPCELEEEHPELYSAFREYYCQDPAELFRRVALEDS